jgi:hypothetical protein
MAFENIKYWIAIPFILFTAGFTIFLVYSLSTSFIDELQLTSAVTDIPEAAQALTDHEANIDKFDYLIVSVFFGLSIALVILSFVLGDVGIYNIVYIISMIVVIPITPYFSNFWEDVTALGQFGANIAAFPITNHIILNLPIYATIIGLLGIAASVLKRGITTL